MRTREVATLGRRSATPEPRRERRPALSRTGAITCAFEYVAHKGFQAGEVSRRDTDAKLAHDPYGNVVRVPEEVTGFSVVGKVGHLDEGGSAGTEEEGWVVNAIRDG